MPAITAAACLPPGRSWPGPPGTWTQVLAPIGGWEEGAGAPRAPGAWAQAPVSQEWGRRPVTNGHMAGGPGPRQRGATSAFPTCPHVPTRSLMGRGAPLSPCPAQALLAATRGVRREIAPPVTLMHWCPQPLLQHFSPSPQAPPAPHSSTHGPTPCGSGQAAQLPATHNVGHQAPVLWLRAGMKVVGSCWEKGSGGNLGHYGARQPVPAPRHSYRGLHKPRDTCVWSQSCWHCRSSCRTQTSCSAGKASGRTSVGWPQGRGQGLGGACRCPWVLHVDKSLRARHGGEGADPSPHPTPGTGLCNGHVMGRLLEWRQQEPGRQGPGGSSGDGEGSRCPPVSSTPCARDWPGAGLTGQGVEAGIAAGDEAALLTPRAAVITGAEEEAGIQSVGC